jgi:hypothetical protein
MRPISWSVLFVLFLTSPVSALAAVGHHVFGLQAWQSISIYRGMTLLGQSQSDGMGVAGFQSLESGTYWITNGSSPGDSIPPARVTSLAVVQGEVGGLQLAWTTTGDDGFSGRSHHFLLRRARFPVTDGTWRDATPVAGLPTPGSSGTYTLFWDTGLDQRATYYYALRVVDEAGNESPASNGASGTTPPDPSGPLPYAPSSSRPVVLSPIPSGGVLTLFAVADSRSPLLITLFDVCGRRVSPQIRLETNVGRNRYELRPDRVFGLPLPAGVYWIRFQHDRKESSAKLVVLPTL